MSGDDQNGGDRLSALKDGPRVVLTPGMSLSAALRELKRRVERAGVLGDLRRHAVAQSPGERRRAKRLRAQQRARKAARQRGPIG